MDENDLNYNYILNPVKKVYKLTKKLGQLYNRQIYMNYFIFNILNINII